MANTFTSGEPQVFELLRSTRERRKHTLRSLALACRMSWGHLSQVENGRAGMSWGACVLLAEELGINRHDLWAARPPVVPYIRSAA